MPDIAIRSNLLVSTEWLERHLDDPTVRVLDPSTLLLPRPDFSMYDVVPLAMISKKAIFREPCS
jgi:3-mercaptopyruvate sulfurtransferase SseA